MFPAQTPPFLRLLSAFAHGRRCAGAAATYLDAIPRLTCEHSSRQPGLRQDAGGGGEVYADQPLPIQDTCLFVPQVPPSLHPLPIQTPVSPQHDPAPVSKFYLFI